VEKIYRINLWIIVGCISLILSGCDPEKEPTLTTVPVTSIEATTAKSGGVITSDGKSDIIVRGVCWSTRKDPTIEGTRTTDGYGIGSFTSNITGLTPNTLYYLRAYATNKIGTGYGNQVTFTSAGLTAPVLTTSAVTGITQTTAVSGGNITSDGGREVTGRGVCWNTQSNPDLNNSKTEDGTGTGAFTSNLTGLTGNTIYYIRAYAINEEGISYGQEISFTTSPMLPSISTTAPQPTSTTTATGGGTISSDGGSPVTARGVCWSTNPNPTIANPRTSDGTGPGTFTSNITGLAVNTEYHIRAYATNSVGTAYGNDFLITTDPATIQDIDNNVYHVKRIGTQLWLQENLQTTRFNNGAAISLVSSPSAWAGLSASGYCWYDNDIANKTDYGALYNWFAVNTGNLCPTGWRVPTDNDWFILETYLGGASPAGGKLKETGTSHWDTPNTGATNETEFTALPGGYRNDSGQYTEMGTSAVWWSSTAYNAAHSWNRKILNSSDKTFRNYFDNNYGMSVRCIKIQ